MSDMVLNFILFDNHPNRARASWPAAVPCRFLLRPRRRPSPSSSILLGKALLILLAALLSGCKTKQQQQTGTPPPVYMPQGAQMQQQQLAVYIRGDVRNPVVPWSEDLTLARAILAAEYVGRFDPHTVHLIRGNRSQRFSAAMLLAGADTDLEPGDIIEIRR